MMRGKIRSVGLSDVGRVREHNEDTIGVDADIGLRKALVLPGQLLWKRNVFDEPL